MKKLVLAGIYLTGIYQYVKWHRKVARPAMAEPSV
jgi:hypothetical protein